MSEPKDRGVHRRLKRQADKLENLASEAVTRSSFSLNNAEETELRELVHFLQGNLDELRLANVQARLKDVEQILRDLKDDLSKRREEGRPTRVIEAMVWEAENERGRVLASLSHVTQTPTRYLAFHHSGELPQAPSVPDFRPFFQNLDLRYSRDADEALRQGYDWEISEGGGFADPDVFTSSRPPRMRQRPHPTAWELPLIPRPDPGDYYFRSDEHEISRSVFQSVRRDMSSATDRLGLRHLRDLPYEEEGYDYASIEDSISESFESLRRGQRLEEAWLAESQESWEEDSLVIDQQLRHLESQLAHFEEESLDFDDLDQELDEDDLEDEELDEDDLEDEELDEDDLEDEELDEDDLEAVELDEDDLEDEELDEVDLEDEELDDEELESEALPPRYDELDLGDEPELKKGKAKPAVSTKLAGAATEAAELELDEEESLDEDELAELELELDEDELLEDSEEELEIDLPSDEIDEDIDEEELAELELDDDDDLVDVELEAGTPKKPSKADGPKAEPDELDDVSLDDLDDADLEDIDSAELEDDDTELEDDGELGEEIDSDELDDIDLDDLDDIDSDELEGVDIAEIEDEPAAKADASKKPEAGKTGKTGSEKASRAAAEEELLDLEDEDLEDIDLDDDDLDLDDADLDDADLGDDDLDDDDEDLDGLDDDPEVEPKTDGDQGAVASPAGNDLEDEGLEEAENKGGKAEVADDLGNDELEADDLDELDDLDLEDEDLDNEEFEDDLELDDAEILEESELDEDVAVEPGPQGSATQSAVSASTPEGANEPVVETESTPVIEASSADEELASGDDELEPESEDLALSDEELDLAEEELGIDGDELDLVDGEFDLVDDEELDLADDEELDLADEALDLDDEELDLDDEELDLDDDELGLDDEELGLDDEELGLDDEELGLDDEELGLDDEELESETFPSPSVDNKELEKTLTEDSPSQQLAESETVQASSVEKTPAAAEDTAPAEELAELATDDEAPQTEIEVEPAASESSASEPTDENDHELDDDLALEEVDDDLDLEDEELDDEEIADEDADELEDDLLLEADELESIDLDDDAEIEGLEGELSDDDDELLADVSLEPEDSEEEGLLDGPATDDRVDVAEPPGASDPLLEGVAPEPEDLLAGAAPYPETDGLLAGAAPLGELAGDELGPELLGAPVLEGDPNELFSGPAPIDTVGDEFFAGAAPQPPAEVEPHEDEDDGFIADLEPHLDEAEEDERLEPPTKEYRSSILEALRQVQKGDAAATRADVLSVLEAAVPKEYRAAVSERRRLVRLSCEYDVNCFQGNQIFHATIRDISLGGMKIEVTRQLDSGSELQVSNPNRTQDEPDERITAQVRWYRVKDSGKAEVGLQFVDPPEVLGRSWVVSLLNKVGMQSQVFNQRKYTRAAADFDIDIIDESGDIYPGRCVDLGLGGALVDTVPVFEQNDILTFRCHSFGMHGLLECESRVVKIKHMEESFGRYALEFESLDASTTKLLGRYVVDLLKLGRGPRSS